MMCFYWIYLHHLLLYANVKLKPYSNMRTSFVYKFSILALVFCLTGVGEVCAKRITVNEARQKALAFWGKSVGKHRRLSAKVADKPTSSDAYYVFNDDEGGFVIISGDDAVSTPVLGYSTTGRFDMASIPDGMRDLLIDYERQIASIEPLPYEASASTRAVGEKKIETAQWGQSFPYNKYCPDNCPTGCVATATAIIMRHYGYPATGRGSNSYTCSYTGTTLSADFSKSNYDWKSMPMGDGTNSHDQAYDGVARLMSDIGIAVGMNYYPGGSSASTQTARLALIDNFGYSSKAKYLYAKRYSANEWQQRLETEIDNDRLVLYSASTASGEGHAFIIDGYKNGLFSVNWGWGGYCNGYFSLGGLQPNDEMDAYNSEQSGLFNICPSDGTEPLASPLSLSANDNGYYGFVMNAESVKAGERFKVVTGKVLNSSSNSYNGKLYAGLFDKSGELKEVMGSTNVSLNVNYYYSSLDINCTPVTDAEEGDFVALVTSGNESEGYLFLNDEEMNVFSLPAVGNEVKTAEVHLDLQGGTSAEYASVSWNCMYQGKPLVGTACYFDVTFPNDTYLIVIRNNGTKLEKYDGYYTSRYYVPLVTDDINLCVRAYKESDIIDADVVQVGEPGTLAQQMKSHNIDVVKTLVVKGRVDQRDFAYLNACGVTSIDMCDAVIESYDIYPANTIPAHAFEGNGDLSHFIMPKNTVALGNNAFRMTGLADVVIPKSVVEYGLNVFNYCRSLKEVTVLNPEPAFINWCVLIGTLRNQGGTLHVPAGCKADYLAASQWQDFTYIDERASEYDIYTNAGEDTSVIGVEMHGDDCTNNHDLEYFNAQGQRIEGPQKGVNILRKDGKAVKIINM